MRDSLSWIAPLLIAGCVGLSEEVEPFARSSSLAPDTQRGLLASEVYKGEPFKGVYFFPGDVTEHNQTVFTATPTQSDDLHWNTDAGARERVVQRIIDSHANTLVMSYWGNDMQRWSPLQLDATSVSATLAAVSGKPLLIVPALESGYEAGTVYWRFSDDFPYKDATVSAENLAPSLLARLREIAQLFQANPGAEWARLYDSKGKPRYAVQIMHVYAHAVPRVAGKTADEVVADAFDKVADEIAHSAGIDIGFLLDVIPGAATEYTLTPAAGTALERANSVLGLAGFVSEIWSGELVTSQAGAAPIDNNTTSLDKLLAWKRAYIEDWVSTGVPVIYDVSSGYDGRFVWKQRGTFFWGDNYDYTFDGWRNGQSALKGLGGVGVTFNAWNGYTEGFAAVPTREHGDIITRWLTQLYASDPRECSHVEFVDGQPGASVQGAICAKWRDLGASRGVLGAPEQAEVQSPSARAKVLHFAQGSIFSSKSGGTHAIYGPIHTLYRELGFDNSCLGLPTSDVEASASSDGSIVHFEGGDIVSEAGNVRSTCS